MAMYNPNTKEIEDAKYGTIEYWHEYRHQLQDKAGMTKLWTWTNAVGLAFLIVFLMLKLNYLWFIIPTVMLGLPQLIFEIDAWIFAIYKKQKKCHS